jgi:hypothetical protein
MISRDFPSKFSIVVTRPDSGGRRREWRQCSTVSLTFASEAEKQNSTRPLNLHQFTLTKEDLKIKKNITLSKKASSN